MTYVNGIKLNKVHKRNVNTNHKLLIAFGVHIPFRICFNTIKGIDSALELCQ